MKRTNDGGDDEKQIYCRTPCTPQHRTFNLASVKGARDDQIDYDCRMWDVCLIWGSKRSRAAHAPVLTAHTHQIQRWYWIFQSCCDFPWTHISLIKYFVYVTAAIILDVWLVRKLNAVNQWMQLVTYHILVYLSDRSLKLNNYYILAYIICTRNICLFKFIHANQRRLCSTF